VLRRALLLLGTICWTNFPAFEDFWVEGKLFVVAFNLYILCCLVSKLLYVLRLIKSVENSNLISLELYLGLQLGLKETLLEPVTLALLDQLIPLSELDLVQLVESLMDVALTTQDELGVFQATLPVGFEF
jgi:hypothetical protein